MNTGQSEQNRFKISIQNIKYSSRPDIDPYGTFSVVVRSAPDNDTAVRIVERYDNCNLNPNSSNYIAKVIGDVYYEWDNTKMRLKEYGTYPNNSKIIRVDMAPEVDLGQADPELLPFGVQGPVKEGFKIGFTTGSTTGITIGNEAIGHIANTGSFLPFSASVGDIVRTEAEGGETSEEM